MKWLLLTLALLGSLVLAAEQPKGEQLDIDLSLLPQALRHQIDRGIIGLSDPNSGAAKAVRSLIKQIRENPVEPRTAIPVSRTGSFLPKIEEATQFLRAQEREPMTVSTFVPSPSSIEPQFAPAEPAKLPADLAPLFAELPQMKQPQAATEEVKLRALEARVSSVLANINKVRNPDPRMMSAHAEAYRRTQSSKSRPHAARAEALSLNQDIPETVTTLKEDALRQRMERRRREAKL